jgi:hypothetical protein
VAKVSVGSWWDIFGTYGSGYNRRVVLLKSTRMELVPVEAAGAPAPGELMLEGGAAPVCLGAWRAPEIDSPNPILLLEGPAAPICGAAGRTELDTPKSDESLDREETVLAVGEMVGGIGTGDAGAMKTSPWSTSRSVSSKSDMSQYRGILVTGEAGVSRLTNDRCSRLTGEGGGSHLSDEGRSRLTGSTAEALAPQQHFAAGDICPSGLAGVTDWTPDRLSWSRVM